MWSEPGSRTLANAIVDCDPQPKSAEEFIQSLLPLSEARGLLNFYRTTSLIFRGHGDASFQLIPGAFREGRNPLRQVGLPHNHRFEEWGIQHFRDSELASIFREATVILDFVERCNEIGLALPVDLDVARARCQNIRHAIWRAIGSLSVGDPFALGEELLWPPLELMSCLSLAQHYGVPTRLLDFTSSPLHAAFFAAEEWETKLKEGVERFAVVCIASEGLPKIRRPAPYIPTLKHSRPVRYGNANASAQAGSFLYFETDFRGAADLTLADVVDLMPQPASIGAFPHPLPHAIGFRVTCPCREGAEVLRLLEQNGISRRHVYPSYGTVAREMIGELAVDRYQPGL